MTNEAADLINAALKLDPAQRALIAAELTASLTDETQDPPETDPEWLAQLEERVRQAQSGEMPSSDWSEVEARIRKRLGMRPA